MSIHSKHGRKKTGSVILFIAFLVAAFAVAFTGCAKKAESRKITLIELDGALIELFGDVETAFDIYYDNYDIHGLPPLH